MPFLIKNIYKCICLSENFCNFVTILEFYDFIFLTKTLI